MTTPTACRVTPRAGLRACERRPVAFRSAPSHANAQWPVAERVLAYRCGGSSGIAGTRIARGPAHRIPVSTAGRAGGHLGCGHASRWRPRLGSASGRCGRSGPGRRRHVGAVLLWRRHRRLRTRSGTMRVTGADFVIGVSGQRRSRGCAVEFGATQARNPMAIRRRSGGRERRRPRSRHPVKQRSRERPARHARGRAHPRT